MIVTKVDKMSCIAKVTVVIEADQLLALLHAVKQCELYEEFYTPSMQATLYTELDDAVVLMRETDRLYIK